MRSPSQAARLVVHACQKLQQAAKIISEQPDPYPRNGVMMMIYHVAQQAMTLSQRLTPLEGTPSRSLPKAKKSPRRQPRKESPKAAQPNGDDHGVDPAPVNSGDRGDW
jgi:ABC-type nitrate/sulfonate/bicarbonate transport system ATPase subunit